ncbi:ABC transporter ATP-binding protein [Hydrogenophaga sp.]|uniref:ABC transporter ATP-binding protein n=1 Tax=Hydrogenophaga sp. TaxID=1904254 RepID=UPI002723E5B1|nr:oligopeptide/dipeptide ABC transporter ATP-binding protein [Hydrogenophaga sp.]MDO9436939.1 ATP-binding cassette domain-containing protein [Hydrogenophaga sp.]
MSKVLLSCQDLTKEFELSPRGLFGAPATRLRAVDGVSFQVSEGQTLGIVGESGCGKSTTAKLLLRLEQATAGSIRFDGKDVQHASGEALRTYRKSVQGVFQDPFTSLNPRMTVGDSIAEPLRASAGLSRRDMAARVAELLDLVGIRPAAARLYPHEFSGGQRQRIAIARGLAINPRVLILDEPVSALDVSIRAQILNLLQDLQVRLNLSYVLISHDLHVIAHMCDRIAVMYLGRIVEEGPAHEIVERPQHPYTEALFSASLSPDPDAVSRRIVLRGEIPSPISPPTGCSFHPRCPQAMAVCSSQRPTTVATQDGVVACHLRSPLAVAA